jgi:hypothetical protein
LIKSKATTPKSKPKLAFAGPVTPKPSLMRPRICPERSPESSHRPMSPPQILEKVRTVIPIEMSPHLVIAISEGGKRSIVEKNNGVDISDLTRFYTKEEWKKLDADVKKRILENPARKKLREERKKREVSAVGSGSDRQNTVDGASVVTNSIDKDSEDRIVAAVIRGVMESSVTNQERNVGQVTTRPGHGSRVGMSVGSVAGSVRSRGSSVTFDPRP